MKLSCAYKLMILNGHRSDFKAMPQHDSRARAGICVQLPKTLNTSEIWSIFFGSCVYKKFRYMEFDENLQNKPSK